MSYNFGSAEQFEQALHARYDKSLGHRLFYRALDKRYHEIAERIHGEMTPEQVFEAWDRLTNDRQDDGFPVSPRWLKHFVDKSFYQELKVYWYRRHAEHRAKFGGIEDPILKMILAFLQQGFIILELCFACALVANFISDETNAQYFFLAACGIVTGFYILFSVINALFVAFFVAPRRSLVCAFNARRSRQKTSEAK
jgi:hypothetical protein